MDYLLFNRFISSYILIIFYYFTAIFMPIIMWYFRGKISQRFELLNQIEEFIRAKFYSLSLKDKIVAIAVAVFLFLMMELVWRMMFEAVIGYFDIHNYLYEISKNIN